MSSGARARRLESFGVPEAGGAPSRARGCLAGVGDVVGYREALRRRDRDAVAGKVWERAPTQQAEVFNEC